jgi:hypothetical protein
MRHFSASKILLVGLLLVQPIFVLEVLAVDVVVVYGISPRTSTPRSWIESFELTIDANNKTVTAREISACPDTNSTALGGGILVVRSSVYYSAHANGDANVYLNGQRAPVFNARTVSGYDGFLRGVADLSGDDTHIWANPWDGTGKVFQFVPNGNGGWMVAKMFDLANARNKYDGMEVFGDFIYANRSDLLFNTTGPNPCGRTRNAVYDKYDANTGALVTAGFITPDFPASGIAFNGTYFFLSEICSNKIAVYDRTGATLIGEADLGTIQNACQPAPASVCVNPNFRRCLEDLSVIVSSSEEVGQTQSAAPAENLPAANRK